MISRMDRKLVFGTNSTWHDWVNQPTSWDDLMFQKMAAANSQSLLSGYGWDVVEPNPHQNGQHTYLFGELDRRVDLALKYNIEFTFTIVATPDWANPNPPGQNAFKLPLDAYEQDFRSFCTTLAQRYLGKVRYFEFWNEPDGAGMQFDVVTYTRWLRPCYEAVKAGNPNALVSVGGLVNADVGFLWRIYNNGGRPYFDAVAVHPYGTGIGPIDFESIDLKHDEMDSRGDGAKSIWLTEYGWRLNGVTEQQQSDWLAQSLQQLWTYSYNYVTQASYNLIADKITAPAEKSGLTDGNLNARIAYNTFRDFAAPRTPRWESKAPALSAV